MLIIFAIWNFDIEYQLSIETVIQTCTSPGQNEKPSNELTNSQNCSRKNAKNIRIFRCFLASLLDVCVSVHRYVCPITLPIKTPFLANFDHGGNPDSF